MRLEHEIEHEIEREIEREIEHKRVAAHGATPPRDARRPEAAHYSIGLERSPPKRSRRAARAASVWAGVAAAAGAGAGATGAGAGATGGAPPPGATSGTSTW